MTAACAKCSFKMEGVSGCKLAIEVAGKVDGNKFVAESFTLEE